MDTSQQLISVFGVPKNISKDFSFQTDLIMSEIDPGSSQIIAGNSQIIAGNSQTIAGSSQTVAGSSQIVAGSSQTVAGNSQTVAGSSQTIAGSRQTFDGSNQRIPESSQKCNLCDRKFSKNSRYLIHLAIHAYDRENPLEEVFTKCSWCPNMFESQIHLDRHITLEHRAEEMLARHKYRHAISKHTTVYKRHTQKTYSMLHGRIEYQHCLICPLKFETKDELKVHERTHTREIICSRSNMKFDKHSSLVSHRYLEHKNYTKQYQCTICHDRFWKKSRLDEHLRKHNQKVNGRYHCHVCGTAFMHKKDLRACERAHLDKITKKCPHCSQFFYSMEHLEEHVSAHSMDTLMSSLRVELADQLYGTKPDGGFDDLVSEFAKASLTVNRDAPSTSGVGRASESGSGNASFKL